MVTWLKVWLWYKWCAVYWLQVYTVDISNVTAVRGVVREILQQKEHKHFVPYEFTQEVNYLIEIVS